MNTNSPEQHTPGRSPMQRASSFVRYIQREGLNKGARFAWWKLRSSLAENDLTWNLLFRSNPLIKTGEVSDYSRNADVVWQELAKLPGLTTKDYIVDQSDYDRYVAAARYEDFDPYYRGGLSGDLNHRVEKLLQHYISLSLLGVQDDDVYVDVASNTSPMRHIVKRLYGIPVYSLDLSYPPGIDGELIGADAGAMPVEAGFASKMTLHCSFEHFAFGADSRFVKECERVLRPGGKVCIIPLYILPEYCVRVDPTLEADISISDTEGADKVYVRGYRVDYGRFYNPESFRKRILEQTTGLNFTVYRIRGLERFAPHNVYSNFALIIEKPD